MLRALADPEVQCHVLYWREFSWRNTLCDRLWCEGHSTSSCACEQTPLVLDAHPRAASVSSIVSSTADVATPHPGMSTRQQDLEVALTAHPSAGRRSRALEDDHTTTASAVRDTDGDHFGGSFSASVSANTGADSLSASGSHIGQAYAGQSMSSMASSRLSAVLNTAFAAEIPRPQAPAQAVASATVRNELPAAATPQVRDIKPRTAALPQPEPRPPKEPQDDESASSVNFDVGVTVKLCEISLIHDKYAAV